MDADSSDYAREFDCGSLYGETIGTRYIHTPLLINASSHENWSYPNLYLSEPGFTLFAGPGPWMGVPGGEETWGRTDEASSG